jgi:anti-sigma B factor antagonist
MDHQKNNRQAMELSHDHLEPGIILIRLSGDLDISGVQQISLKFTTLSSTQRKPTIVDMSGITLITSMGVGMLLTNANTLRKEGKVMIILKPNPNVEKVLKLAGAPEVLPIEHDLESAVNRATLAL